MTIPIQTVDIDNDTWRTLVGRVNSLISAVANNAVTAGGDATVGNVLIYGTLSANTILQNGTALVDSSRTIQVGAGLTGGGTLANTVNIGLDANTTAALAKADAAVPSTRTVSVGAGLTGGGALENDIVVGVNLGTGLTVTSNAIELDNSTQASLSKADAAVPSTRTVSVGAGLTGGGTLANDINISLNPTTQGSLSKAETAIQPGNSQLVPAGGPTDYVLTKSSNSDFDLAWKDAGLSTAVRYTTQSPSAAEQKIARANIDSGRNSIALSTTNTDWNTLTTPGFSEELVLGNAANGPIAAARYFYCAVYQYSGRRTQWALPYTASGTNDSTYYRTFDGTSWSMWYAVYSQRNIVGTVSQSGGIPTGSILERGGNSNGDYIKYADGTMICSHWRNILNQTIPDAYGSTGLYIGSYSWTYPAAFVPTAGVFPTVITGGFQWKTSASWGTTTGTWTATSAIIRIIDTGPRAADYANLNVMAIGRWF